MEQVLFGERLKNAREASGMSRQAMASRLGVKLGTVEDWESGKIDPRANRLQMLASLLNVPLLWLLAGGQQVPAPPAGISDRDLMRQKITELTRQIDSVRSALEDLRTLAESSD